MKDEMVCPKSDLYSEVSLEAHGRAFYFHTCNMVGIYYHMSCL